MIAIGIFCHTSVSLVFILAINMPPNNTLPIHGNEKTMNLNTMILTNIQASPYFKVQLYELKTYHQVIDEIYTRVSTLKLTYCAI